VRQVIAGLGIENDEIPLGFHHGGEIVEGDVGAGLGIVEAAVGVFLDDHRLFLVRGRIRLVEHERRPIAGLPAHCAARTLTRHCEPRPAVL
jgi:hypothetical protein